MRKISSAVLVLSIVAALSPAVVGEEAGVKASTGTLYRPSDTFQRHFDALGKRVKEKGKAQTRYVGELIDAEGRSRQAKLSTRGLRAVQLEGFKGKGSLATLERGQRKSHVVREESALLESLGVDTVEGLFGAMEEGTAAVRLLGRDFSTGTDDPETKYDIYEATMADSFSDEGTPKTKLYYFDSKTHLLVKTEYQDRTVSPPTRVETRFSTWGTIDGSSYPASIERFENGKRVFSFVATSIESEPESDLREEK